MPKSFLRVKKSKTIEALPVNKVDSVPSYIQANARRGLDLLEYAGGGLTDKTKREARSMARGEVSDDKAKRMAAWFARHISDLDSPSANEYLRGETERPTAGQVAWLLWGGDLTKSNRLRAMKWAERQSNDEKAAPDALSVGDFVSWNSSGGRANGKIIKIERDGSIDVPNTDFTINGTEDDPAALIQLYRDGEPTDVEVGHRFSALTKIDSPKGSYGDDDEEEKKTFTTNSGKTTEIWDAKHIRMIQETEDSIIIEFGKADMDSGYDEEERYEEKTKSLKPSFLKRCVTQESEDKSQKRFKATVDITAAPTDPIYDDGRIVDYQNVVFKGYASTNEEVTKGDRIGDYLRKGAFKETIREFKKNPVMLIDHENSTRSLAGSYTEIREDDMGLYVEGKLSNAPELATVRTLIAEGHLKTLSIGGMFYYEEDGKGIAQVDLMEISLVAIPMNPDARFEVTR